MQPLGNASVQGARRYIVSGILCDRTGQFGCYHGTARLFASVFLPGPLYRCVYWKILGQHDQLAVSWHSARTGAGLESPGKDNQAANQSSNQSVDQALNEYNNQSINQWIKHSGNTTINQSINRWIKHSVNTTINQSINQWKELSILFFLLGRFIGLPAVEVKNINPFFRSVILIYSPWKTRTRKMIQGFHCGLRICACWIRMILPDWMPWLLLSTTRILGWLFFSTIRISGHGWLV